MLHPQNLPSQAGSFFLQMSIKVGRKLRQKREARSLSLEQISQATHMRIRYLQALEAGKLEVLPSKAQARGFLRAYADYLDMDSDALLLSLDQEGDHDPPPPSKNLSEGKVDEAPQEEEQTGRYFIEVGQNLQQQRELLGLSLDDVERHTHLRLHYLQALEAGELDDLPSPVQGRGMLNNYASFLGMDPEPLLLKYAEGLQAQLAARQAAKSPTQSSARRRRSVLPAPLRRFLSGDILIGGIMAVSLLVFIIWGAIRIFAMQSENIVTPTAPSIADVLLATATSTHTATPAPPTPTQAEPGLQLATQVIVTQDLSGEAIPPGSSGTVQVTISVRQRAWMRVVVDGEIVFDGRVLPGSAYDFTGVVAVEILTGNGGALNIFLNGQNLGFMGANGQVVHRVYSAQGISTPTPTITMTPTNTAVATETPPPSPTSRPGEATVPPIP